MEAGFERNTDNVLVDCRNMSWVIGASPVFLWEVLDLKGARRAASGQLALELLTIQLKR